MEEIRQTTHNLIPVLRITPFCSDALVSPPNLYPPCFKRGGSAPSSDLLHFYTIFDRKWYTPYTCMPTDMKSACQSHVSFNKF